MSTGNVEALRKTLDNRDPFCRGVCPTVPEHQLSLYYGLGPDVTRIDFAHSTTEQLEALSKSCQPASFGLNKKDVLDETYRKAGKMDLNAFSTLFDPRSLGIHNIIERDLLATNQAVEFELSKLNVYEKDGFFKAHQDTPCADTMFGSLVVVFPAPHTGGQLSLRLHDRHWIVDFADQFSAVAESSVCFVAFFSDVEHQVLPVMSGHRVTLTYNLHFRAQNTVPRALQGPFHDRLKAILVDLVNDPDTLPQGGYLGLGLCHQYAYDETNPIDSLKDRLKGSDAALANVCRELGLPFSLRLLYAQEADHWPPFHLLSRKKLSTPDEETGYDEDQIQDLLRDAVNELSPEDIEGVEVVGRRGLTLEDLQDELDDDDYDFMKEFYKDPVTQVLEVKKMSSVRYETAYACYGNYVYTDRFYGTGCMVISVKPKESRERLLNL